MAPSSDRAPLKHSTYQILLALGTEEMHGYGIMQALTEKTDGRESILPGTLYAALSRMVDEGMVEEIDPPSGEESGGPPRRYYRRTALGAEVARDESERLRGLLDLAAAQNLLSEPAR